MRRIFVAALREIGGILHGMQPERDEAMPPRPSATNGSARPGRTGPPPYELVERPRDGWRLNGPDGRSAGPPNGSYNFVRVHGETPGAGRVFVSAKLAHADLAQGRPVVYAGTAAFERGALRWWSNHSGTYQPIAAFRDRARLPEDKFVPWQRLQADGMAQQRAMLRESRPAAPPPGPAARLAARPAAAVAAAGHGRAASREDRGGAAAKAAPSPKSSSPAPGRSAGQGPRPIAAGASSATAAATGTGGGRPSDRARRDQAAASSVG
jgi:hypothetical protein